MFSRSKRFQNKPVGCGADAVYDPKDGIKPIGGVIPKMDRFIGIKSVDSIKSDTDSVHSDKSLVFRTPKLIRHNSVKYTNSKKLYGSTASCVRSLSTESFSKDIINAKNVEIKNKDATISENEVLIKEMKKKISDLSEELNNTVKEKEDLESKCNCSELEENLALVKSHHALALEANQSIRHEFKLDTDNLKMKHEEDIKALNNHHNSEIEALKNVHQSDLENIIFKCNGQIKVIEDDFSTQMKEIEEDFLKQMQENKLQHEEQIKTLEQYRESCLKEEKEKWETEVERCQETAEIENKISEIQIQELKDKLQSRCEDILSLSNNLSSLQITIDTKEKQLIEVHSQLTVIKNNASNEKSYYTDVIEKLNMVIEQKDSEIKQIKIEKNKFSFILDTTRQALDALSARLKVSDEDVEKIQKELDITIVLKDSLESELTNAKQELIDSKNDYNELLLSIVNLKALFDESQKNILENITELTESSMLMEKEFVAKIESLKNSLFKDIHTLKKQAIQQALETKKSKDHKKMLDLKAQCDKSYDVINECRNLLSLSENQLEMKDQELNELETENDRLTGTLAAVEQEKNELVVLLNEFKLLLEAKDKKIHQLDSKLFNIESDSAQLNDILCQQEGNLEITEKLLEEKDSEIRELKKLVSTFEDKIMEITNSHNNEIDLLKVQCKNLEKNMEEMTKKYTDIVGHQNNKQKIKHVIDLKTQNYNLKQENEKLTYIVQKHETTIEKLKKDVADVCKNKSPLVTRKQILGKENISSPRSPRLMGSPKILSERPLTPLKDSNR